MRRTMLTLAALTMSAGALAQSGMPGGMDGMGGMGGGGMGGMGGGMGGRGGPPDGGPSGGNQGPRPMKPVKREKFDKAVTAMFRIADTDRNGVVTLKELQAIVDTRREAAIQARFDRIDANHDGSLDRAEFFAWQRQMGSAALSGEQAAAGNVGRMAESIVPDLKDDTDGEILARLIAPIDAMMIVTANTNYDDGMSLDELLAYERARFDAADIDKDGELSMDEVRELARKEEGRGPGPDGAPPGRRRPPGAGNDSGRDPRQ